MSDTEPSTPSSQLPTLDPLGRPPLAAGMKKMIDDAFTVVPDGKRGAVLLIHDIDRNETRAHLAAKIGEKWRIAGGAGFDWTGKKPTGWVGVGGSW